MSNDISMYMTNFKNQTYEFPMAPSEFTFNRSAGNEKIQVIELGEINRLATKANLGSVSLKFNIPIDTSKRRSYWSGKRVGWMGKRAGEKYIGLLNDMFTKHEVVRVVLTNTKFNNLYTFDDFNYGLSGNGEEYEVEITLTEWRDYAPLVLKKAPIPKKVIKKKPRPAPSNKIGIGSTVIVNGQLHYDSWGRGPGVIEKNARRKINFMAPGRKCPIHVTNMQGGWRGWVTRGSVRSV